MASCPVTGFDCLTCDEATCRLKSRMTPTPADPIAAEARVFLEILTAGKPEAWTLSWNARKQLMDFMEKVAGMKSAGRAEASAWRPISECPENRRVYVYGWHRDHEPSYDEEAMAWKDQIDGKFYYAPQGGVIDWTPTHFAELMGAPLPPPPEGGE